MSKSGEEVSVRSRESVDSLQTMEDTESTETGAQQRRAACAWTRSQRPLGAERLLIQAAVVAQSMEGHCMNSLWRVQNVIEGGQGTREEAKGVRDRVIATVEQRWKAGELKEPLPLGEKGEQVYIQIMVQEKMGCIARKSLSGPFSCGCLNRSSRCSKLIYLSVLSVLKVLRTVLETL